jgi:hypothetical protein
MLNYSKNCSNEYRCPRKDCKIEKKLGKNKQRIMLFKGEGEKKQVFYGETQRIVGLK